MDWSFIREILTLIQHVVSLIGILIILSGVLLAAYQYIYYSYTNFLAIDVTTKINTIRLHLGRILILGLEFIVAADLIGTTTTPDYYALGMLAIIVAIRTFLSFSINRELMGLTKENNLG